MSLKSVEEISSLAPGCHHNVAKAIKDIMLTELQFLYMQRCLSLFLWMNFRAKVTSLVEQLRWLNNLR